MSLSLLLHVHPEVFFISHCGDKEEADMKQRPLPGLDILWWCKPLTLFSVFTLGFLLEQRQVVKWLVIKGSVKNYEINDNWLFIGSIYYSKISVPAITQLSSCRMLLALVPLLYTLGTQCHNWPGVTKTPTNAMCDTLCNCHHYNLKKRQLVLTVFSQAVFLYPKLMLLMLLM